MRLLLLLATAFLMNCTPSKSVTTDNKLTFNYSDGTANGYVVKEGKLIYDPVKMEESSSGEYSGGEPKTVELSNKDISNLRALASAAVNCTDCHQDKRMMMTGQLTCCGKTVILENNSEAKNNLESALKELLK